MKTELKELLKPIIAKHYPILENSPDKLENAASRLVDMLEELRTKDGEIFDAKRDLNKQEYHSETISGSIEYDVIFDYVSEIMFDQFKPLPTITVNHSDGTTKTYDDFDDAVIDANYELTSILEHMYTSSAETMLDAAEPCRVWRNYVIAQHKIEREQRLDAHVCNGCEHWKRENCICWKPEGSKCIRGFSYPLPTPVGYRDPEARKIKFVEDSEYIRRADECIKALVVASNIPGATITIKIENNNGAQHRGDCYCEFYDHAALVSAMIEALEDFKSEMQ